MEMARTKATKDKRTAALALRAVRAPALVEAKKGVASAGTDFRHQQGIINAMLASVRGPAFPSFEIPALSACTVVCSSL